MAIPIISPSTSISGAASCPAAPQGPPEHAAYYAASGLNLTVCGHAHGGQVRIPGLVNGLYAPGQGVLPPYAGGLYSLTPHSALAVSRGLVRNLLPRPGNPPEMAVIQLTGK